LGRASPREPRQLTRHQHALSWIGHRAGEEGLAAVSGVGGAFARCRRGQEGEIRTLNLRPNLRCHQIPRISVANEWSRRDPKKSRILGEQILRHGCLFWDRLVRRTRAESRPSNAEGSREFNSPSLRQAVRDFSVLCGKIENTAHVRAFLLPEGLGETVHAFPPPTEDNQVR
jgi:hypothetical protein